MRGSTESCDGYSGGPVFSFLTDQLFGVSVGCYSNESLAGKVGLKAVIVPWSILSLLRKFVTIWYFLFFFILCCCLLSLCIEKQVFCLLFVLMMMFFKLK